MSGPSLPISEEIHAQKYRLLNESFDMAMYRIADHLKDSPSHFRSFLDILMDQRFLPGGRVQSASGAPREVTAYNCFVSGNIDDSMNSIMLRATEAAETMRRGGGIGYDFSKLRPRGELIRSLDSRASGPISFMGIFDAVCQTISSAGHRRGAQMGCLRIDHPDVEEFIAAKQNSSKLTGFNISLLVTDRFMNCLMNGDKFPLMYEGRVYKEVDAEKLWKEIMRTNWDWAEPGVLFVDQINRYNNLWYAETISATNPCGEQPLPPYGACLLGSFNLVKYIGEDPSSFIRTFDFNQFEDDIYEVVRAMDNVIDRTTYPLPEQEQEAKAKRRMGLGVTGMANAFEALGYPYGSEAFLAMEAQVLKVLRDETYRASAELAEEKGPFPLFHGESYLQGAFIQTLPESIKQMIAENGIRNSHLTSVAPTGTISLTANNVSSGVEPPFSLEYQRTIQTFDGPRIENVRDYGYHKWGIKGVTALEATAQQHVEVLATAQRYIDSAVSKTCNVGDDVTFDEFSELYTTAWQKGAKGITTFRAAGKRYGILNAPVEEEPAAEACYFDTETGKKTCE